MGKFVGCVKYLLFIFNFTLWLLGCTLLSVGIWLKLDDSAHHNVKRITQKVDEEYHINYNVAGDDDYTETFAYLLIAFGIIVILITFIGCCGAVRENTCFLRVYAVCLFILSSALIGIGVWAHEKKGDVTVHTLELKDKTDKNVKKAVERYFTHQPSRDFMDNVQEKFHCCGANMADRDYLPNKVPNTCLLENYGTPCPDPYFRYVGDEIQNFLEQRYAILAGISLSVGIFMGLGMVVTLLLCCLVSRSSSARVS